MSSTPHDALFKATFRQPDLARSELELVLPADVREHLDLATLAVCPGSFIDAELQQIHSDLLYAVRTKAGAEALVYVLFEHQSSPDPVMAFRFLRYVVRVWERWLEEHRGAKTLPIVLPILLHHGDGSWTSSTELAEMFDASPELLAAARPFVPHFRFVLDDLMALAPAALASRKLAPLPRLVQLAMWASRSFPRLRDAMPFMRTVVATLARDGRARTLLEQVYLYLLATAPPDVEANAIRGILLEVAGPEGQEDVVNAAEQLIEQGRAKGLEQGLEQGLERGLRGLREGITAALTARSVAMSEIGRARLASCADVAMLTRWLTKAVTATSEADVFAPEDGR